MEFCFFGENLNFESLNYGREFGYSTVFLMSAPVESQEPFLPDDKALRLSGRNS